MNTRPASCSHPFRPKAYPQGTLSCCAPLWEGCHVDITTGYIGVAYFPMFPLPLLDVFEGVPRQVSHHDCEWKFAAKTALPDACQSHRPPNGQILECQETLDWECARVSHLHFLISHWRGNHKTA